MRIIGEIPHPLLKIQVFKMGNKYAIKLETDLIEQTYKLRESSTIDNFSDVKKIVDPIFLEAVIERFKIMKKELYEATQRALPLAKGEEFPFIL